MPKKQRTSLAPRRVSIAKSKRAKKSTRTEDPKETTWFDMIAQIRFSESYVSLLLGVIVVVLFAVLFITTARNLRQPGPTQQTSSTSTMAIQSTTNPTPSTAVDASVTPQDPTVTTAPTVTVAPTVVPTKQPAPVPTSGGSYVVKAGDSLWSIAEAHYKSGYNWTDIAKANNLTNPGDIHVGNRLIIPKTIAKTPTTTMTSAQTSEDVIKGTTYTIKRGDDLWDIAVRAYGDGYRWVDIAKANKLTDPGLIHADNTLTIPR